jgi:DHA1 family bicyclomycin/chloramphenicol resistance-like MFS transporter
LVAVAPPSNNLILEQVDHGAGTASSFMILVYFMIGAFSMWFIALDWINKVHVISLLAIFSGGIVLSFWLLVSTRSHPDTNPTKSGR